MTEVTNFRKEQTSWGDFALSPELLSCVVNSSRMCALCLLSVPEAFLMFNPQELRRFCNRLDYPYFLHSQVESKWRPHCGLDVSQNSFPVCIHLRTGTDNVWYA